VSGTRYFFVLLAFNCGSLRVSSVGNRATGRKGPLVSVVDVPSLPGDQSQAGRMPHVPVRLSYDAALLLFVVILVGRLVIAFSRRHAE
jgi:hypothetical protein